MISLTKIYSKLSVESIFEQTIKTTGNESISKALLEDRTEILAIDNMLKKYVKKSSYYLTEKSKQLLLNAYGDVIEHSIQSQDTPTKYFTASETENYGNMFLVFKQYIIEELNDLKNRLEALR